MEEIFSFYLQYGGKEYFGEPVSQAEHMSQTAGMALEENCDNEVVLAAFFHDIGHICAPDKTSNSLMIYGHREHEKLGAEFLKSCGFSERITALIENHVPAKRYLTYKNKEYFQNLSEASKKTLEFQGGVMSPEEAVGFEASPYFKDSVRLRLWDERAKELNIPLLNFEIIKDMAREHLEKNLLLRG